MGLSLICPKSSPILRGPSLTRSFDREIAFEPMISEYAEIEDAIHKLWNELLDEQEHFAVSLVSHPPMHSCFPAHWITSDRWFLQSLCHSKSSAFELIQERRDERHDGAARSMKAACKGPYASPDDPSECSIYPRSVSRNGPSYRTCPS